MKIGIVIHSQTGNTLSVGERLREALLTAGHTVQLERVTAANEASRSGGKVSLTKIPDVTSYNAVVFGAPVQAFSLSPVMKTYLAQLPDLRDRKIACFVTQQFPKPWMGGTRAIKQIINAITQKGTRVVNTGIVNWSGKMREEQISDVIARFSKI